MNDHVRDNFREVLSAYAASAALEISAEQIAKNRGAPLQVTEYLQKAAFPAASTGSGYGEVAVAAPDLAKTWFLTLRTESVFARLLTGGAIRVPLRRAFGVAGNAASGYILGEGKPAPLTLFGASRDALEAFKAVGLMGVTREVASASDEGSVAALENEMRGAVADAIDAKFWQLMGAGSSGFSLGTSSGFRADTEELLTAVNTRGVGPLVWAMSPDVANKASYHDEFMSPLGGELLGLPAMVSPVIPAGTLRLVNAAGVAGDLLDIKIDSSSNASLEMKDESLTQDGTTGTGSATVSAFQSGFIAVRAVAAFGASRVRANACHEITGITWAAE